MAQTRALREEWEVIHRTVVRLLDALAHADSGLDSPAVPCEFDDTSAVSVMPTTSCSTALVGVEEGAPSNSDSAQDYFEGELHKLSSFTSILMGLGTKAQHHRRAFSDCFQNLGDVGNQLAEAVSLLNQVHMELKQFGLSASLIVESLRKEYGELLESANTTYRTSQAALNHSIQKQRNYQRQCSNEMMQLLMNVREGKEREKGLMEADLARMNRMDPARDRRRVELRSLVSDLEVLQTQIQRVESVSKDYGWVAQEVLAEASAGCTVSRAGGSGRKKRSVTVTVGQPVVTRFRSPMNHPPGHHTSVEQQGDHGHHQSHSQSSSSYGVGSPTEHRRRRVVQRRGSLPYRASSASSERTVPEDLSEDQLSENYAVTIPDPVLLHRQHCEEAITLQCPQVDAEIVWPSSLTDA